MRAERVTCPQCGANLEVGIDQPIATCSYCGTASRIQRRTGFFHKPPPPPPNVPAQVVVHMPIAHVKSAAGGGVIVLVVLCVIIAGGVAAATAVFRAAKGGIPGFSSTPARDWRSATALVHDVNGDGVVDALGRVLEVGQSESPVHLVAYDGKTGAALWESEVIGSLAESYARLGLGGELLLYTDSRGGLRAYSVKDGTQKWKVNLGERLKEMCVGTDQNSVLFQTSDEKWVRIALVDGNTTPASPGYTRESPCKPLPSDERHQAGDAEGVFDWSDGHQLGLPRELDGMWNGKHIRLRGNDYIALGNKQPGTRVPLIASYTLERPEAPPEPPSPSEAGIAKDERRRRLQAHHAWRSATRDAQSQTKHVLHWKQVVPSGDPLTAKEGAPESFAIAGDRVVVAYEVQKGEPRLTAFSVKTGERLWELSLQESFITSLNGIAVGADRVFITVSQRVDAIDARNGTLLWSAGDTKMPDR